jgi:ABC-type transport system substrate-binding protein
VRQALAIAIDREYICDILRGGHDTPALGGFVPPPIPGHSPTIGLTYDPDLARSLLEEAGFKNGDGFPPFKILTWPLREEFTRFVTEQWLEMLGVKIGIQTVSYSSYLIKKQSESHPMYYAFWVYDYPDPDSFLRVSRVREETGWDNEDYNRLIARASVSTDDEQRIKLYKRADRILIEEAIVLPLVYGRIHRLVKPWVKNRFFRRYWDDVVVEPH